MAVSKVILNGDTLMDVTQDSVTASTLIQNETATRNDGVRITGSAIAPTGTKSITISSAGTTTEDVTNYASAAITVGAGTEGTPTATKGTVSNHAIAVTPSVTNSAGYISGGTKSGTAVSVSASELVSGTYSVTGSGTKDVTNYASISVPAGSVSTPATSITANPTISVDSTGLITASVSGSQSVTPSVSAGYVSSGTAGTATVSGSNTQQLPVYAGAHHAVISDFSVTISLTNPYNASEFSSCIIFEAPDEFTKGQQIGSIDSPTGSATVTLDSSMWGIMMELRGAYVEPPGSAVCTGGVSYYSSGGGTVADFTLTVTGDGTAFINGIDWDD